jgi:hypothetical protein
MSWKFTRRRLRNDAYKTNSGNTGFVLRDDEGDKYRA